MKRCLLLGAALAAMVGVSSLALQQDSPLLIIKWAGQGQAAPAPVAVLIEMGTKDLGEQEWSGQATVTGATIFGREGYRFRTSDKLDGNGWTASSHRAIRAPKGNPAVSKMEPIATVGVVLFLKDIKDGARLTVEPKDARLGKAEVPLAAVLAGRPHKLWKGAGVVRLITAAMPVETGKTEDDFPAAAYGADGTLWVAYISYHVKENTRRIEAPNLKTQPKNFKSFYTPEFRDQLFVKYFRNGKWSAPIAVTGADQDLARCAIACDKDSTWVAYSTQRSGNFDIYLRRVRHGGKDGAALEFAGEEQRLTTAAGPDITPAMCTDQKGNVWLACQSWGDDGRARISVFQQRGNSLKPHVGVESKDGGNLWHAAIAADNTGKVAVAFDVYRQGSYDVGVIIYDGDEAGTPRLVAATPKAEMRPAVAYQGDRLWIAYEEGPEDWGKDSGAFVKKGEPLYSRRSVRVVSLDADGKLSRPAGALPESTVKNAGAQTGADVVQKYESGVRFSYPRLGVDLKGRLWLAYRQSSSSRYSSHGGSYWLSHVRRLDDKTWSEPIEVQHADGLLDSRPVLLPHRSGGLQLVHNTDGRYTTAETMDNQIYASVVDLPGGTATPALVTMQSPSAKPAENADAANVARIRKYRIQSAGKEYQILRGEYHRHTEISWDGGADGSLEDMFRYAIDAAGMDWIGNGDHDNGGGREYSWWLTQKFTDAYHVPRAFTPMFTYERSVSYPHGHRNVLFAQRGIRTLPRLAPPAGGKKKAEGGVHPDDTKMLYRYLREFDGICAVHTSATGMGTDWRDNDPVVEPIVEIYQGDRMNYEMEGAPRSGFDPKLGKEPANIAGWFPKGYINLALGKGYRLGFQASSDHWSTHISYFMVLAEKHDRAGILAAVKKRHVYAATDNIIVNVQSGSNIQGDELKTRTPPSFKIEVIGTNGIAKIDVLRDSQIVDTLKPDGSSYTGTWTDSAPLSGTHYYYIRVLQRDNELAWSSPMWIEYVK